MGCQQSVRLVTKRYCTCESLDPLLRRRHDEESTEYESIVKFLSQVPLFRHVPKETHPLIARACIPQHFTLGQVITKQGEVGTDVYVVRGGRAQAFASSGDGIPEQVAILTSGDHFGENALQGLPRRYTVRAAAPLCVLAISEASLKELTVTDRLLLRNRRVAVWDGNRSSCCREALRPGTRKTQEELALVLRALQRCSALGAVLSFDESRARRLAEAMRLEVVPEGKELITAGDEAGGLFYIVQHGSFEVVGPAMEEQHRAHLLRRSLTAIRRSASKSGADTEKATQGVQTRIVQKGGSFGELALLHSLPQVATVRAMECSKVWAIDRQSFKAILMKASEESLAEYFQHLRQVQVFSCLLEEERRAAAKAMIEMRFQEGDVIVRQGDRDDRFWVVFDGEVSVQVNQVEQRRLRANGARGTLRSFGEWTLLGFEAQPVTVRVTSQSASAMFLDKHSFEAAVGPVGEVFQVSDEASSCGSCLVGLKGPSRQLRRSASRRERLQSWDGQDRLRKFTSRIMERKDRILKEDLQRVGPLGRGAFGSVELWEHATSGETYAVKLLNKGYVVKIGSKNRVMTEKLVLSTTSSSFIVALYETYNEPQTLSFLLEAALGGELHETYKRQRFYGSEAHARYYVGGVVYAFEHLHERQVIYRDLKPENLLLNHHGHLKVTDFGLSKFVVGKTYTICGSPDYFAPEMIVAAGHTHALDWWTLGILIYELMTGNTPFEADYPLNTYSEAVAGMTKSQLPPNVQGAVGNLVLTMCHRDPSERLPMRRGGISNLREHSWFNGFDWFALQTLTMKPPYQPKVHSRRDLSNFCSDQEECPGHVSYAVETDDGTGWDEEFATA